MSTERYTVAFCDILLVHCVTKCLQLLVHVGWQQAVIVHNYSTFVLFCFVVVLSLFCCDLQRTFSELSDPADLHRKCQELCQSLAEDMQKERVQVC